MTPTRLIQIDKLKDEIAAELPLSEVAAQVCDVELYPSGHQQKGLCPIHEEDTPSFHVNDAKGVFHCFGCKQGGDAIALVRLVRNLGFYDALYTMAEVAGVDISKYERPLTEEERKIEGLRTWFDQWLTGCTQAYVQATDPPHGSLRVLDEATIRALRLGISKRKPANISALAGEIGRSEISSGTVIFPYCLPNGRPVALKARPLDGEKKMFGLRADEWPLHESTLFGVQIARDHLKSGRLIVVEGEWDCAILHEAGIRNVVALGGSRFTPEHMAMLVDLKVREVVFWLDGDEGGMSAARTIAQAYWQDNQTRVKIAMCPEGMDPEDLIRSPLGAMAADLYAGQAKAALHWLLWQQWESEPRDTLDAKLDFVAWIQEHYGDKLRGLEESLVLREVSKWMDVPEATVLDFARADKTMLQAPDSEKILIGKAIREQGYYRQLRKRLQEDDFYVLRHRRIWNVLAQMLADGLDFDLATIKQRAGTQGIDADYLDALVASGDTNITWHEDLVLDYSVRRSAREDADRFREVIADPSVPSNQAIGVLTHSVTSKALGRAAGAAMISDQVDEAMEVLHQRMANPDAIHGLDVGSQFPQLMRSMQGFQPRRLVLVAATSGVGKSTISLQWATALAIHQAIPTDFLSLEMDASEILFKQAAHLTGIDGLKITGGQLSELEAKRVEQAMLRIRKSPLRIYAPDGISPSEFVLYARESVMDRRTEVFIVDYAQMVGPDPGEERLSRYEQLRTFAYMSKQKVARALDVTVIACAQLQRAAAELERPTKENMGDSYELVRAADVILILNENEDSSIYDLWIDKNRQGPGSILVPVEFRAAEQTFREAHGGAREPDYQVLS